MNAVHRSGADRTPLRIAVIAPPWYPLPPMGYGGIELVVSLLVRELRRRGHVVTVFGAAGSGSGTTELAPAGSAAHLGTITGSVWELTYLARVFEAVRQQDFDVIHDHSGVAGLLGSSLLDVAPVVHTVHGPIDDSYRAFYDAVGRRASLVALSESQRRSAPDLTWAGVVHNAVDVPALWVASREEKGGYLVALARISPDKGQHTAIEVARRTGRRLILAGKIEETPRGREYFHDLVAPHVDGDHVRYIPNVHGAAKAELLARAHALLAPIYWQEPFGLSVAEAMASGTPAISFACGSAPELIEDGRTGFVVADTDRMAEAVTASSAIDPLTCARLARSRFNPAVMADRYLGVYAGVAETSQVIELSASRMQRADPGHGDLGVESELGDLRDDPRMVTGVASQQDLASLVGHAGRLECRR